MKYFHFNGSINEGLLDKFLEFINDNQSDELTIILNSIGGKRNLSLVMLDVININSERITLISCGVYSAAFFMFYNSNCKRKMTYGNVGMMHYASCELNIMSNGNPAYSEDVNTIKNWKEDINDLKFVEQFMNPKEIKSYKKGNDVYFTFKRMKEIFPDVEII